VHGRQDSRDGSLLFVYEYREQGRPLCYHHSNMITLTTGRWNNERILQKWLKWVVEIQTQNLNVYIYTKRY
jgi:hypothetical protein